MSFFIKATDNRHRLWDNYKAHIVAFEQLKHIKLTPV